MSEGYKPKWDIGTRIVAYMIRKDGGLDIFGSGIFDSWEGEPGWGTPRLKLDCGVDVFGCECWWTEAEEMNGIIEIAKKFNRTIKEVSARDFREKMDKWSNRYDFCSGLFSISFLISSIIVEGKKMDSMAHPKLTSDPFFDVLEKVGLGS